LDILSVFFLVSVFIAAGLVQGVLGFGLQWVVTGLVTLLPGAGSASSCVVPLVVANMLQIWRGSTLSNFVGRFGLMFAGVILGSIGVQNIQGTHADTLGLYICIASLLAALTFFLFGTPRLTARSERWCSPLVGVCTGAFFGASFGAAFPGILYLKMLKLTRDELVQALGSLFFVCAVAWLGRSRALDVEVNGLSSSVWLVIPAGVGLLFGYALRREVEDRDYDRWFACGLLFVAASVLTCSLAKFS
jgi:uncharacterized membrane protein YfcA